MFIKLVIVAIAVGVTLVKADCPDFTLNCPTGEPFGIDTCWRWRAFSCQTCISIESEVRLCACFKHYFIHFIFREFSFLSFLREVWEGCMFFFFILFSQRSEVWETDHLLCAFVFKMFFCMLFICSHFGPRREKTCLRGIRESEFQTSLVSYKTS